MVIGKEMTDNVGLDYNKEYYMSIKAVDNKTTDNKTNNDNKNSVYSYTKHSNIKDVNIKKDVNELRTYSLIDS